MAELSMLGFAMRIAWVMGLMSVTAAANASGGFAGSPEGSYSVLDYGAKGDGTTDDTGAFQRAANDAADRGGYVIVPPVGPGKGYVLTRTVRLPRGVSLIGSPAGFGNNAWAAFDLPEKTIHGVKLLARPQPSDYAGTKKRPLFILEGGNTVRGFWIMYDQQPWPTDGEFNDPRSPYHYDSFEKARASFIKDHVKPCGPSFYLAGGANVVMEDIVCDRYYDFFFQAAGGRSAIDRVYLYGYKRGFVIRESYDVNRLSNIHLCPGTGPACPGDVGGAKRYSWIYGIVASQPDCVGVQLGKSDGYCFSNLFFYGVHTGIRFGASAAYPLVDPVEGVECYYDPAADKLHGFKGQYKAAGPWGCISNLGVDCCAIGIHLVWPTTMTTCMLSNAYLATALDDGRDFPAKASPDAAVKRTAYQGAFVVEPTYCAANDIGIVPTLRCSNAQISSFKAANAFGPASAGAGECNGRVFLINGDVTMDFSNLQINSPYSMDYLYTAGDQAGRYTVRIRGLVQTGEPLPDVTIGREGVTRPGAKQSP